MTLSQSLTDWILAEIEEQGNTLFSCSSSYIVSNAPFHGLFNAMFFVVTFVILNGPKHSVRVLSTVLKCKKVFDMPYRENTSEKLYSGRGYSAADHEFSIKQLPTSIEKSIFNLNTNGISDWSIDWLIDWEKC